MKKMILALAVAGFAFPSASLAQNDPSSVVPGANVGEDTEVEGGMDAGATVGTDTMSASPEQSEDPVPGANVGETTTVDATGETFMGAMTGTPAILDADTIAGFTGDEEIVVVSAGSIEGLGDDEAFTTAVTANAETAATLREQIAANAAFQTAVTDAGVTVDTIQAIEAGADGGVIIYTD